jgi:hypothetical protein
MDQSCRKICTGSGQSHPRPLAMGASTLLLALVPWFQNIKNMLEESQVGRKRTWFSYVWEDIYCSESGLCIVIVSGDHRLINWPSERRNKLECVQNEVCYVHVYFCGLVSQSYDHLTEETYTLKRISNK